MISTRGGSVFPLDQRRRDALLNFCEQAAKQAELPLQTWIRRTFDFEVYEAKEVIRGNASEALWERIVKHPNGGWPVVLPVMGAVIGQSLDQWLNERLAAEERRLAREQQQLEAARARVATTARDVAALVGLGRGRPADPDLRMGRDGGSQAGDLGRGRDEAAVETQTFAPKRGAK
jgi:hypothetical protein